MDSQESNKINATEKLEEVQNELNCSICHDYFVQASTLSCSHSFCFNCINAWRQTHTDCPVCRREILGMAPSRALDNMVAALVDRTTSEAAVQAGLQQFGVWHTPAVATSPNSNQNRATNVQQAPQPATQPATQQTPQELDDSDYDNDEEDYEDWEGDEEEEDSYSDGSYDAEEEEYEGEEEEEDQEEEEEEDDGTYSNYEDDDDDDDGEEFSEDEDDEHATRSNQNNPNNDEYWRMRGWSGRPDNWKDLVHRQ